MIERTSLSAGTLRIDFIRDADRYRHEVLACEGDSLHLLLSSVEGISDEPWPASPPLQELHVEQRSEGQVALLVGRAGRSHWSLSVEADPVRQSLRFDVACRAIAVDDCLRSIYRGLGEFSANSLAASPIALASDFGLQIVEGQIRAAGVDDHLLRVMPRHGNSSSERVTTFRWQYQIARMRIVSA